MNDDRFMAELLGDAPETPDPAFRFEVFARIAARSRRRRTLEHMAMQAAIWTALGLLVPLAHAPGFSALWSPLGLLALAGLAALLVIEGPRGVFARSRALLKLAR